MSYQTLFEKLDSGALVLTANARLSRNLISEYLRKKPIGSVSTHPKIYSWQSYFLNTYQEKSWTEDLKPYPKILSPFESHWIWSEIIQSDFQISAQINSHSLGLIQPEATAKTVHRAYEILLDWCLDFRELNLEGLNSREWSCFMAWAELFENKLNSIEAVTQAQAFKRASEDQEFWNIKNIEKNIILLGFEDFSPRFEKILKLWECLNLKIENFKFSPKAKVQKLACKTQEEEWSRLAQLAKFYSDKNLKVGVVIPEIVNARAEILESFFKYLEPDLLKIPHPIPSQFSISGGEPLAQVPIIWEGLFLLENLIKNSQDIFNLYQWRIFFLSELIRAKWPGDFTLSSFEHQAVMKFYEQMEAWLSMSFLVKDCDSQTAFESLKTWLENVFFQPKSEEKNSISLYGPLEISGLIHDVLLIANMNISYFPADAKPNPYLPYEIQKKYLMPHATALRELEFANAELEEWRSLCDNLIATYSESDGGIELRVSPLIQDFPNFNLSDLNHFVEADLSIRPAVGLANIYEYFSDFKAPELSKIELNNLKSGVNIFQSQAACPFQAFAKHRLKLKPLSEPIEPLNLQARGILTHRVLENLMPSLLAQEHWEILEPSAYEDLIKISVLEALKYIKKIEPKALPYYLEDLEKERLINLMHAWINLEKTREPFDLLAQEREIFGVISDIPIRARIDRIDKTKKNNLKIIMDYKTGRVSFTACLGDRPDEPQLALYALMTQADRIVYAKVNIQDLDIEGLEIPIEEYKNLWIKSFENLAQEFKSGYAVVMPKYGDLTCSRCDFVRLCRKGDL